MNKKPHEQFTEEAPHGYCDICGIPKPVKQTCMGVKESTATTKKRKTCLGRGSRCHGRLTAESTKKSSGRPKKAKIISLVAPHHLFLYGMVSDTTHL